MEGTADSRDLKGRWLNPTLVVFLTCLFGWIINLYIGLQFSTFTPIVHIPLFALSTIYVILIFTPLHDSVHRAASKSIWLNDLILWGTWPLFIHTPGVFKKIHLTHHIHTNKGSDDPDHFTSAKTWTVRWLKSMLLIFSYYVFAVKKFPKTQENLVLLSSSAIAFGLVLYLSFLHPLAMAFFWLWLMPSTIGIGILGFIDTSWPHHPGTDSDRMKNTKILLVSKPLQWLMLNQNYHLIHHLRPSIPWYGYEAYWNAHKDELLRNGAEVIDYRHK